jgi:hypothetical protein
MNTTFYQCLSKTKKCGGLKGVIASAPVGRTHKSRRAGFANGDVVKEAMTVPIWLAADRIDFG